MALFRGLFTAPSWQSFSLLAWGWALGTGRHTMTTSVWLPRATPVQHFSRFSVFLGCPLYPKRWPLWGAGIRQAARLVPAGEVMQVAFDDTTKKKAGRQSEGRARYRNGAGSARQAYRTLRGVNVVLSLMRIPLTRWPGHSLSVPVGCALSLKAPPAHTRNVPSRSRRQLARDILDFIAQQLPGWAIRSLADGGYATKEYLRQLPAMAHAVGRFPISAKLYEVPPPPISKAARCHTQKRRADWLTQNLGLCSRTSRSSPCSGGPHAPWPARAPAYASPTPFLTPSQGWLPARVGLPLAGQDAHLLDDRQHFMKASHPPVPIDPHCLVALIFLYSLH
jgi:hypothetical protein